MGDHFDLLLRGGECVTPGGLVRADLAVRGGAIAAIEVLPESASADVSIDARGLTILPGAIDTQVHFREPGNVHKEDLATGTAAAALGGVTTVFEMPNTDPPTTSRALLEDKLTRARGRAWVDHAFFVGATAANADSLGELEALPGCCGVKVFMGSSTGSLLVPDDATLERVLRSIRRRAAVHAEDQDLLQAGKALLSGPNPSPTLHPFARSPEAALTATKRLITAAERIGRRVHVLHVTTLQEVAFLAEHRHFATFEITPQHLTLRAPDCYDELGTLAQMNPPIRDASHQEALWRAVRSGLVDVIGSDHAPHTLEEKARPYPESPSGMPGVQTILPLMLDHAHAGRLSLLRVVDLLAHGPARVYNMAKKGRLAVGYDADLSVVDLKLQRTLSDAMVASRCGWTPFRGRTLTGWPMMTVVRGQVVAREGELLGSPIGEPARFTDVPLAAASPSEALVS
jgi:dihydroorotase